MKKHIVRKSLYVKFINVIELPQNFIIHTVQLLSSEGIILNLIWCNFTAVRIDNVTETGGHVTAVRMCLRVSCC